MQPKLITKWSVDAVLKTIEQWEDNHNLSPQKLTWKLAMLMALTASNRVSELSNLDTRFITKLPDGISFNLTKHRKNRKSNLSPGMVFYSKFPTNKKLCPCACMEVYISRTKKVRNQEHDPLFRSYIKPYNPVRGCTISRWITNCIKEAGYDVKENQNIGHSARGNSASKAQLMGIPLPDILKAGEWKSSSTYAKHYYRPDFNSAYGRNVLSTALNN